MSEVEILRRRVHISRLYDLYAPLLTERQRNIYEMHELDDLSLSEISSQLEISRQAVSDQLQRGREKLGELEQQLKLLARLDSIEEEACRLKDDGVTRPEVDRIIEVCRKRTVNHV